MTPNDVKIVADNIDDFIEVPDGVLRLRKAVLTLAVSGKLVPQYKKEGTADELYSLIKIELAKTENDTGRKRKRKELTPVADEEIPFDIPRTWKWVRFEETFTSARGITFPGGEKTREHKAGYVPVLRSGNVQDILNFNDLLYVPEKYVKNRAQYLKDGDVVVSMANSRELVGKSSLANGIKGKYSFGGFLSVFRPVLIVPEYFQIVFSSDFARERFFQDAKQVTNIANLSLATINLIPFPLPPLAEQKRIVEKVQSVMKQLDELEVKKQERDEMRTRLVRSAMQSLGKSESKIAFEQLTELVKTPSDIKELENALLTLAVSGKLVPQSKADGTAENLYNQIQKERTKAENNSTARKKKTKDLAPIADDEIPFEVPASWKWVRLGELFRVDNGFAFKSSNYVDSGVRVIRITNVQDGLIVDNNPKYISDKGIEEYSNYILNEDDLLMSLTGNVGRVGLIKKEMLPAVLNQRVARLHPWSDSVKPFLYTYLRSALFQQEAQKSSRGMAQANMSTEWLKEYPIPLPPLLEQKRIVKKVEEVMTLINRLKEVVK